MSEATEEISGSERAAVFMMSLGEEHAAEVLKHMGPKEVQKVGTAMASLSNVSKSRVNQILTEFAQIVDEQTSLGVGSDDYIRNVLVGALGEDKAGGVIDRILLGHSSKGLEALKWMDPRAVADIIRLEHPQIISIVLSYLDSDHAAGVLNHFPERTRADLLMRIATLDGIQPSALQELNEILERQFAGASSVKNSGVGGVKTAANILNFMNATDESAITESITEADADLAREIQDLMFVFDNLIDIDDRGIQVLLREASSENLLLALKGADDGIKEKIFNNMSERAAEMMRDDLDAKGPVRLSDVEAAQKEILSAARRLADAGEIALGGAGGDEYI